MSGKRVREENTISNKQRGARGGPYFQAGGQHTTIVLLLSLFLSLAPQPGLYIVTHFSSPRARHKRGLSSPNEHFPLYTLIFYITKLPNTSLVDGFLLMLYIHRCTSRDISADRRNAAGPGQPVRAG